MQGGALAHTASLSCAAAESEGSASRAFCAEIALEAGKAPDWIRLFPAGPELAAADGRRWTLSDPAAVASLTDRHRGSRDLPIDWNHAQDIQAPQGLRSDAAGWIKELAARDGALAARVEWTDAGRESVESKAYRYISPSFAHERRITLPGQPHGGEVRAIAGAGLVNRPAFDMPALAGQQQEDTMLKKILEALGLAADAGEEQALAAVKALAAERDEAKSLAAAPPLERFVPRADYDSAVARASAAEGKLASQAAEARGAEIKKALDAAQEAGRITPASRSYHEAQCQREGGLEAFSAAYGEGAPSQAPGPGGGSAAPPPPTAAGFASEEEAAIASMFGRDAKFLDEHAPRSQGAS